MTAQPVIQLQSVCFSYDDQPFLETVNLSIEDGDFVCLVGPNGGGKSTLLKLFLGLLKPQQGTIRILGLEPDKARRQVGYMPQYARYDPLFPVSVLDVVLTGSIGRGNLFGPFSRQDKQRAEQLLESVGLKALGTTAFAHLSGGQRQRVLIARALMSEPRLLLLDEPTSNLDLHVEGEFYNLLCELNLNQTIVMVSHDLGVVSNKVRTVVCVNRTVHLHPTSALTGDLIKNLYGSEVQMVRHDVH